MARADAAQPYIGGRTVFGDLVRRVRRELAQQQAARDVPVRFEGLPAEYLQVDWGEIRRFPFTQQPRPRATSWPAGSSTAAGPGSRFTGDMRQETLFRGLVDCFLALGWVPWVLVFDNMKTVTSGRDAPASRSGRRRCCSLPASSASIPRPATRAAGNQKGSVESLVKWVKGNFLAGPQLRRRRRSGRADRCLV